MRDARMKIKGKKRKKERKKENEERRKERMKEGKNEKGKGRMAGDGRRSPAAAGVGRSWPEKAAKAPSPRNLEGCKSS